MQILRFFPKDRFGSNMYVIEESGEAAVIDPSVEYLRVKNALSDAGISNLRYIILTHAHFDHFFAINSWKSNTEATVIVGEKDKDALNDSTLNCYKLFLQIDMGYSGEFVAVNNGDRLPIGNTAFTVIETPGHTKGSVSLLISNKLFSGDTVFSKYSYGRTDLPGGNYYELMETIEKIKRLSSDTVIYPGHGNTFTVNDLK